jgi:hypothetical protein
MRTLPKGSADTLRSQLSSLTRKDAAFEAVAKIQLSPRRGFRDESHQVEMGWRSGTLAVEGTQETPAQAKAASLRQAARAMFMSEDKTAEFMAQREHTLRGVSQVEAFRSSETRLQDSVAAAAAADRQ